MSYYNYNKCHKNGVMSRYWNIIRKSQKRECYFEIIQWQWLKKQTLSLRIEMKPSISFYCFPNSGMIYFIIFLTVASKFCFQHDISPDRISGFSLCSLCGRFFFVVLREDFEFYIFFGSLIIKYVMILRKEMPVFKYSFWEIYLSSEKKNYWLK